MFESYFKGVKHMDFDVFKSELKQLLLIIPLIPGTTKFSMTVSMCLYSFSIMS